MTTIFLFLIVLYRSIEIIDLQTEEKFIFIAGRWLAVDQHDGSLECSLPVAGALELKDFNFIFSSKSRRDFSDAHIWFSIYARPPRSSFTRSQRLSVLFSFLPYFFGFIFALTIQANL